MRIQGEIEPTPCSWHHRQETHPHQMSQISMECVLQLQGIPLSCPAMPSGHGLDVFIWFDIASFGSCSDSQIFLYSNLRQKIKNNTIGFPPEESHFNHGPQVEYCFIGDAFPL